MKIAISINTSWNIYNFRQGLVKRCLKEGHTVLAIAPEDEYSSRLVDIGCVYESVEMDPTGANPLSDFKLILTYYNLLKRTRPDILLQFTIKPNIYGTLAAHMLGIPVVNNVSGLGTVFLNHGIIAKIAVSLYRFAFNMVDLTFFQNKEDELDFKKSIGLPNLKCEQLPGSGVNLKRFKPQSETPRDKHFTFLMIARLIADKGVYEYIEAARNLLQLPTESNAKFLLIGKLDTSHRRSISSAELEQWITDGTIEYLEETSEIEHVIHKANCVVLPSYREGTPRTLLEAAAMGKPLITTNVPGCKNVVENDYNGFLCKEKDADALEKSMRKMLELSLDDVVQMGINSRKLVEQKFDENIVIDRYIYWVNKLGLTHSVK